MRGRRFRLRTRIAAAVVAAVVVGMLAVTAMVFANVHSDEINAGHVRSLVIRVDLVGLAVAIVLGVALGVSVARPIGRTIHASQRFGAGELDTRIPVRGSDDLADLAASFNAMAARLSDTLRDLHESQTLQHRFVADVSHELRTPLAAMLAAGDGLDSPDPVDRKRAALLVQAQARRMSELVEDLLEMSRFDAGQAALVLERTDLAELVPDVVRTIAPGADVRVSTFGDVTADIDVRRVHTILRNLVGNALQHGAPPVDVLVDGRGDTIDITVADDGPGIDPALVPTIFDRFVRADTARSAGHSTAQSTTRSNTGLGLAIALENTRLHGASLTVSTAGRTAFALRLPRNPSRE